MIEPWFLEISGGVLLLLQGVGVFLFKRASNKLDEMAISLVGLVGRLALMEQRGVYTDKEVVAAKKLVDEKFTKVHTELDAIEQDVRFIYRTIKTPSFL